MSWAAAGPNDLRLGLSEALEMARGSAYRVMAARHDSAAAEHGLRAARAAWLPTAGVSVNAFTAHPLDPVDLGLLRLGADWHELYATNIRLSYPIFTGGRRVNAIQQSRENVLASTSELLAARLANAYRCRQAYITLLIADRVVRSTEASLERVQIIQRNVENLMSAGMADSIDVLDTEVALRQVRRMLEETRADRRNASASLANLVDVATDMSIVPTEEIPTPAFDPDENFSGREGASRRPEVSAVEHRIQAASHQRAIVRARLFPVVSGTGGYALAKPEFGVAGDEWRDAWWVGLSLSWDLNLAGMEVSESQQALETVRSLEMHKTELEKTLVLQAQLAWNRLQEAYNVYVIRAEELDLARRRFRLAAQKRDVGRLAVNRLLELEAELTVTEQQYQTARLRFFAARTEYLYATGSDELWKGL
jgi:outer membrane protein TolC